jgi:hypothetical protein
LLTDDRARFDVTVSDRGPDQRVGIALHRYRSLHPDDRAVVDGVPLTSVARTLLDIAPGVPIRRSRRAFEQAERRRLFDRRRLEAVRDRNPRRPGLPAFCAVLAEHSEPPWTKSELERAFLDFCDDAGLPRPVVNGVVEGHEVDAHWPGRALVVELDSFRYHRTRASFEADRRRDAALLVAERPVLRITQRRLRSEPERLSAELSELLATCAPTVPRLRGRAGGPCSPEPR